MWWLAVAGACLLLTTAVPAGSALRAATPGLVAAFAFSAGAGSTAVDSSGTGNTGSLVGATWTTAGRYGNGLAFDESGRVDVPDAPSLDLTTGMTLEAWVFPTELGDTWRDVVYKGNDAYYLEASAPGGPPVAGGTFAGSPVGAGSRIPLNTWSHLAATYDGSSLRIYVNGAIAGTKQVSTPIATTNNALSIGGDAIYGQDFVGRIDEVRVYNVALAAAQIQADMNTPIEPGPDTTPPTVSMTAPPTGESVSHVVALAATASDDVGVQAVQFFVDGWHVGEDDTAPYTLDWDSTGGEQRRSHLRQSRGTPPATRRHRRAFRLRRPTRSSSTRSSCRASPLRRRSRSFPTDECSSAS